MANLHVRRHNYKCFMKLVPGAVRQQPPHGHQGVVVPLAAASLLLVLLLLPSAAQGGGGLSDEEDDVGEVEDADGGRQDVVPQVVELSVQDAGEICSQEAFPAELGLEQKKKKA